MSEKGYKRERKKAKKEAPQIRVLRVEALDLVRITGLEPARGLPIRS